MIRFLDDGVIWKSLTMVIGASTLASVAVDKGVALSACFVWELKSVRGEINLHVEGSKSIFVYSKIFFEKIFIYLKIVLDWRVFKKMGLLPLINISIYAKKKILYEYTTWWYNQARFTLDLGLQVPDNSYCSLISLSLRLLLLVSRLYYTAILPPSSILLLLLLLQWPMLTFPSSQLWLR